MGWMTEPVKGGRLNASQGEPWPLEDRLGEAGGQMHFVSLPPLSGQLLRYSFSAQLVLGQPTWKSRYPCRVMWCFSVAHSGPLARMALLLFLPLFLTPDALGLHQPNKASALNPCLRLCVPRQAKTMNIMLRELHMRRCGNHSLVKYGHNFNNKTDSHRANQWL